MDIKITKKTERLAFFKDLYESAKSSSSDIIEELEKHYQQYKGDKKIDGSAEEAQIVRNITYELIESQISSYIPAPVVSPALYSEENERRAKSIEFLLRKKKDGIDFETMNDMDERYNPIYGGSVWLVEWDNSIITHNTVGDVRISCLSPKDFVGQPYIYHVQDMEYCFVKFDTTKEEIERRYGVHISIESSSVESENSDDKTATLIVCYYRDNEDKICQYVWSGEEEIFWLEDYYARKRKKCKLCGKRIEICACEHRAKTDVELMSEEYEELESDIVLVNKTIPAKSPVIKDGQPVGETRMVDVVDELGRVVLDVVNGISIPRKQAIFVPEMKQTKLPFYTPKTFPIVIRKNTSQEKSLLGQSDCAFIRPQQQGVNKIESRIMQKLIRAGVTPVVPEDASISINNSVFGQVIKMRPGESVTQYGKIDTTPNISQDLAEAERLYEHAKRILGINNSFQGQYESSAQSGVAKEAQIRQAAGRLDSKRRMKNAAYAGIYRIVFELYLAYSDEPRPIAYKDVFGRIQNYTFNRYDFVEMDEAGEYYYNDEFLFSSDSGVDSEENRPLLWQENRLNLERGAYGKPQSLETLLIFWQNQERAHYPYARENVERIENMIAKQAQVMNNGGNESVGV